MNWSRINLNLVTDQHMPESYKRDNSHSVPVQEIMGTMPAWITRWGITIIFFVLISILVGSYFIRYPETVSASVSVVSISDATVLQADQEDYRSGSIIIRLVADVHPNNWHTVQSGQKIVLHLSTGEYRQGVISEAFPTEQVEDNQRRLLIEAVFDLPIRKQKSLVVCGMEGTVDIIIGEVRLFNKVLEGE